LSRCEFLLFADGHQKPLASSMVTLGASKAIHYLQSISPQGRCSPTVVHQLVSLKWGKFGIGHPCALFKTPKLFFGLAFFFHFIIWLLI